MLQDRSRPYVAVDANRDQGIVTITLRGELDSTARSALSEHLTKHLAEYRAQLAGTQPRQLVIDMAEVDFLDWVLAAALSAHRSAAFDVHVLAGLGCDAAEVAGSGFAVVVAGEEAGERVDEVE